MNHSGITVPFLTREDFEAKKAHGEIQADVLFLILDYDFCKQVWETSPLIKLLTEVKPCMMT